MRLGRSAAGEKYCLKASDSGGDNGSGPRTGSGEALLSGSQPGPQGRGWRQPMKRQSSPEDGKTKSPPPGW